MTDIEGESPEAKALRHVLDAMMDRMKREKIDFNDAVVLMAMDWGRLVLQENEQLKADKLLDGQARLQLRQRVEELEKLLEVSKP